MAQTIHTIDVQDLGKVELKTQINEGQDSVAINYEITIETGNDSKVYPFSQTCVLSNNYVHSDDYQGILDELDDMRKKVGKYRDKLKKNDEHQEIMNSLNEKLVKLMGKEIKKLMEEINDNEKCIENLKKDNDLVVAQKDTNIHKDIDDIIKEKDSLITNKDFQIWNMTDEKRKITKEHAIQLMAKDDIIREQNEMLRKIYDVLVCQKKPGIETIIKTVPIANMIKKYSHPSGLIDRKCYKSFLVDKSASISLKDIDVDNKINNYYRYFLSISNKDISTKPTVAKIRTLLDKDDAKILPGLERDVRASPEEYFHNSMDPWLLTHDYNSNDYFEIIYRPSLQLEKSPIRNPDAIMYLYEGEADNKIIMQKQRLLCRQFLMKQGYTKVHIFIDYEGQSVMLRSSFANLGDNMHLVHCGPFPKNFVISDAFKGNFLTFSDNVKITSLHRHFNEEIYHWSIAS